MARGEHARDGGKIDLGLAASGDTLHERGSKSVHLGHCIGDRGFLFRIEDAAPGGDSLRCGQRLDELLFAPERESPPGLAAEAADLFSSCALGRTKSTLQLPQPHRSRIRMSPERSTPGCCNSIAFRKWLTRAHG